MAEEQQIIVRNRELTTPLWSEYPDIVSVPPDSRFDITHSFVHMQAECIPTIPIEFVLHFWDYAQFYNQATFYFYQNDDPACFTDQPGGQPGTWRESWIFHPGWEMLASILTVGFLGSGEEVEVKLAPKITPTKPYLKLGINNDKLGDYGYFDFVGIYEVMPKAAYDYLMAEKVKINKKIDTKTRGKSQVQDKLVAVEEELLIAEAPLTLYNYFSDQIAQYEAIHGI